MESTISIRLVSIEEERKIEERLRSLRKGLVSKLELDGFKHVLGEARFDVMLFEALLSGDLDPAFNDHGELGFKVSQQGKTRGLHPALSAMFLDSGHPSDVVLE